MSEIFGIHGVVVALVALLVIGPKDLPRAMRVVGYWVGKARGVSRQFRAGFDQMVREAELEEMEKKWAAENERIMREHPATRVADEPLAPAAEPVQPELFGEDPPAIHVEKPELKPASVDAAPPPPTPEGAAS